MVPLLVSSRRAAQPTQGRTAAFSCRSGHPARFYDTAGFHNDPGEIPQYSLVSHRVRASAKLENFPFFVNGYKPLTRKTVNPKHPPTRSGSAGGRCADRP
jgi:hypothetical protein